MTTDPFSSDTTVRPLNPAIRGGVILFICLLAVFPCGAALTVIGSWVGELVRSFAKNGHLPPRPIPLWIPVFWAGGGVLGFLLLISGADKIMAAPRRLPWYVVLAICLEIAAAGLFSATYPLRGSSAIVFRLISVAPVAIALALLVHHLFRFIFRSAQTDELLQPTATAIVTPDTREPRQQ